ncbi:unnamed protein product [Bemisia tabaci]|uniref:Uncharacterized protein n=1 Tax=Bemisia tabaci TaxID=7038 RepID=A0A9P0AGY1_BEMTA|nr:unnamed protein product [Bemisia tabaci]
MNYIRKDFPLLWDVLWEKHPEIHKLTSGKDGSTPAFTSASTSVTSTSTETLPTPTHQGLESENETFVNKIVLKNERDKTKLKFIKDNDYIPYSEYVKLYLNKNPKKTNLNSNSKNKKIDQIQESDKKSNTDKEENSNLNAGKNKKETLEPTNNTGNKRDFAILGSHPEMETEDNEPKVDLKPKETVGNKNSAKKPPPIFIINEEPDAIKDTLKDYRINYTLKNESNQKFKLMIKSEEDYKVTLQKLVDLGVKFYTFQFFGGKTFKRSSHESGDTLLRETDDEIPREIDGVRGTRSAATVSAAQERGYQI